MTSSSKWKWCCRLLCLYTLVFITSAVNAAGTEPCSLKMGWEPWHPYQYLDENGELTGFDIDVIGAISRLMGCEVAFEQVNWARGMVDVENGNLDLIFNANYTDERSVWAHYSEPYRDSSIVMYIREGESGLYPYESLKDICSTPFKLGVGRGVVYSDEFTSLLDNPDFRARLQYIPTSELQQYEMLQAGRVDGFLRSITALGSLEDSLGHRVNLEVHPMPVVRARQHVIFSKKSVAPEIVERFDEGLRKIRKSGLLDLLVANYFE